MLPANWSWNDRRCELVKAKMKPRSQTGEISARTRNRLAARLRSSRSPLVPSTTFVLVTRLPIHWPDVDTDELYQRATSSSPTMVMRMPLNQGAPEPTAKIEIPGARAATVATESMRNPANRVAIDANSGLKLMAPDDSIVTGPRPFGRSAVRPFGIVRIGKFGVNARIVSAATVTDLAEQVIKVGRWWRRGRWWWCRWRRRRSWHGRNRRAFRAVAN